jgi:hypothetical protein
MKRPNALWITALALGWFFDFLFWKHAPGISFAVYVVLCLAGGFLVLGMEGLRPNWRALLLLPPIGFFAVMTFVRLESLTQFDSVVLTLGLMSMLAFTYLGGRWLRYGFSDYASNFFKLAGSMLARPIIFLNELKKRAPGADPAGEGAAAPKPGWKRFWAVVRGLLIAIPVLALFAGLLSSADAVFAQRLDEFLSLFRLDRLPEYIFRAVYILVGAYLLAGVILHAALKSRDEKLIGEDKPLVTPFLGFIEAAIVLGTLEALFLAFVAIQVRYFFGGQTTLSLAGYTYAEYARRGFGELVAVAFFSLLLFLGMSGIVRRESAGKRLAFSGLGIGLVALIAVILVSAFQRLGLYEAAYGFTRLRTYTHVFMIWLGVLLGAVVVLELLRRERLFVAAMLLAGIGFAASLGLLNVDGFIVRQNVARAPLGQGLDVAYLASLSSDAVPALVADYRSPALPGLTHDAVGAVLVCRLHMYTAPRGTDWQSFTLSRWRADQTMAQVTAALDKYRVDETGWPTRIYTPGGVMYECQGSGSAGD